MASKVIGRVLLNFAGEYNEKIAYKYLDVVTFKGSSYVCKVDSTGKAPDISPNFVLLAKGGEALNGADYALKKDVPKVIYDAEKHTLTVNDKTVDLATKQKIDKDNADKEKKPSDYTEGFSYELKNADALSLDRSIYEETVQDGTQGMLTTTVVNGLARQHLEVLDSKRPLSFERNGSKDSWGEWELLTTWAGKSELPASDNPDSSSGSTSNAPSSSDSSATSAAPATSDSSATSAAPASEADSA